MVIESHDASVDIIGSEPEKWKPQQRETADHSLPYITAVALIDGEVTDKQFAPERFTEPKIVEFLKPLVVGSIPTAGTQELECTAPRHGLQPYLRHRLTTVCRRGCPQVSRSSQKSASTPAARIARPS